MASRMSVAPIFLFIVADDLGWADTNPYGSTFHETPNISRLAKGGMMLKNFHSTSPVCSPARASLMTGLYAERLGMIQPACHIPTISLEATLPERGWPHKKSDRAQRHDTSGHRISDLCKGIAGQWLFDSALW